MILAVSGAILIIVGVIMVVRKTAETWLQRRAGQLDETAEKPKVSYPAIVLIGLGALLLAIASSGSPPP
jgi:putative Mn2+ efflux pump MntP